MSKNTLKTYPKILSNIPKGQDLFKAGAHKNISSTIITIIEKQGDVIEKQIIGLEGSWGTGKSNIIKIIQEDSQKKYLHFTYDTWTHQEDLTRKSILQELIFFLKSHNTNVIKTNDDNWIKKENELSQKVISKNTTFFPKIKMYYVLTILAFIIIKFGNETYKQPIGNRLYGFYENAFSYLIEKFCFNKSNPINWEYLLKSFPFILLVLALYFFTSSFIKEIRLNSKTSKDKKLPLSQLLGKLFYWVSGEKLESNSNETINEQEPSNQIFRTFLNDIDNQLKGKKKILIFTIDNTDRLSDTKLKDIWSTINIFFAESSNFSFLKNIWLIIPYDENRVISAMGDIDGKGLLEKTFAISFQVPPPLLSNWELFFDNCFEDAFKTIDIDKKEEELQLLKKIFQASDKNTTPRKIINFINQITSYYVQNPEIKLRYNAIVILNKKRFSGENVNEVILNKNSYLEGIKTVFNDDELLEINISKIVYGLKSDSDAAEVIFVNVINDILENKIEITDSITNSPAFHTYFDKEFKAFIDKNDSDKIQLEVFEMLTKILLQVEKKFIESHHTGLYKSLWLRYYQLVLKNEFIIFGEMHKNIIKYCSKRNSIKLLENSLDILYNYKNKSLANNADYEEKYVSFLLEMDNYLEKIDNYYFHEVTIRKNYLAPRIFLDFLTANQNLFEKYKLSTELLPLTRFLQIRDGVFNVELLIKYKESLIMIKDHLNLEFLIIEINTNWLEKIYTSFEEAESLMIFHKELNTESTPILINNLLAKTYHSLLDIALRTTFNENYHLLHILLLLNYNKGLTLNNENKFIELFSNESEDLANNIINAFDYYFDQAKLLSFISIPVDLERNDLSLINTLLTNIYNKKALTFSEELYYYVVNNYTKLLEFAFFKNSDFLTSIFDNNYNYNNYDLSLIDVSFLYDSKIEIQEKILEHFTSNPNLLTGFLSKPNSQDYKLFDILIKKGSINSVLLDALLTPFCMCASISSLLAKSHYDDLMELKKYFDSSRISTTLFDLIRVRRLRAGAGIILFVPEVFTFIDQINPTEKTQIINTLVREKDFFTTELVDNIINLSNQKWKNTLIEKIKEDPDSEIYNYCKSRELL